MHKLQVLTYIRHNIPYSVWILQETHGRQKVSPRALYTCVSPHTSLSHTSRGHSSHSVEHLSDKSLFVPNSILNFILKIYHLTRRLVLSHTSYSYYHNSSLHVLFVAKPSRVHTL